MRPPEDWPLWEPFTSFTRLQIKTLDYDPFHPVLWEAQKGMDREHALWSSACYMAWYSMGSAYCGWTRLEPMCEVPKEVDGWHIGLQRRNLRTTSLAKHLNDFNRLCRKHGSIYGFLTHGFSGDRRKDWIRLNENLLSVWGNGRWAAYTTAELFQKVNSLPVTPSHFGMDGASGPRVGMLKLAGLPKESKPDVLEANGAELVKALRIIHPEPGIPWARDGIDAALGESLLCDFQSLLKGRYYVGRDIDRIAGRIALQEPRALLGGEKIDMSPIWEIRGRSFPPHLLTERRKITPIGVDWARAKLYRDHGIIADYEDDFMLMM